MDTIAVFLLKSVFSSGILFCYYWFALRNKKFHHYNRFYLLLSLLIPVITPFINLRLFNINPPLPSGLATRYPQILSNIADGPHSLFTPTSIAYTAVIIITAVMLLILLARVFLIIKIKSIYPVSRMNGFNLIETDLQQAPFSFFNNLFWRKSISMFDDNGKKIFAHELAHIKEGHSYDKLYSQAMCCIFWINPFYWLIQKELNVVHEFIADSKSINEGDAESFAEMLLQSHNEGRYLSPSHSFFNSSIKRRLIMITKPKNSRYSYLRRVLALPVAVAMLIMFSFSISDAQNDPRLHPNDSVKVNKVSINKKNDSLVDVKINYTSADGKMAVRTVTARLSYNDSLKGDHVPKTYVYNDKAYLYDEEHHDIREAGHAEVEKIVKQIIQDPPSEKTYYVDGGEWTIADIKKLDPGIIKTVNIFNHEDAVKRYNGKVGKAGVIAFTTK